MWPWENFFLSLCLWINRDMLDCIGVAKLWKSRCLKTMTYFLFVLHVCHRSVRDTQESRIKDTLSWLIFLPLQRKRWYLTSPICLEVTFFFVNEEITSYFIGPSPMSSATMNLLPWAWSPLSKWIQLSPWKDTTENNKNSTAEGQTLDPRESSQPPLVSLGQLYCSLAFSPDVASRHFLMK